MLAALHPWSRRRILISAFVALSLAATRRAISSGPRTDGCFIAPEDFDGITIYNKRPSKQGVDIRTIGILDTSSDLNFDRALGRVLVKMSQEFGVKPGFGYYDDSAGTNAVATPLSRIKETRGTVLFGIGLLNSLLAGADGDVAVLAVCAHEFAHILQYETREMDRIRDRLPSYCAELYADFLAGYFLRVVLIERPWLGVQGVGAAWERLGSSDFNHPGTHGTSLQRLTAIESGYVFAEASGRDLDRAMNEAFQHVSEYA